MNLRPAWLLCLLACCLIGCAAPEDAAPDRLSADEAFRNFEEKLTTAETVRVKAEITAEGAVTAAMKGQLTVAGNNKAHLLFNGRFDGEDAKIGLISNGNQMRGGAATGEFRIDAPQALNEGILVGLSRMGVLHNVAKLVGESPPDGTDGKVRDWVTLSNFEYGETERLGSVKTDPVHFDITVAGQSVGKGTLWLNPENGMPVKREQTVSFPEGEMKVVETYRGFVLGPEVKEEMFLLDENQG